MKNSDGYSIPLETAIIPHFKFALREDLKDHKEFLPKQSEPGASGYDVRAALVDKKSIRLYPGDKVLIPLGFKIWAPNDYWLELKPRSSTFWKKHLNCLYGTIDFSFESELMLCVQYIPPLKNKEYYLEESIEIKFGEALGQIIPVKRREMIVEEISNEEYDILCKERNGIRGTGGFGSSG